MNDAHFKQQYIAGAKAVGILRHFVWCVESGIHEYDFPDETMTQMRAIIKEWETDETATTAAAA